MAQSLTGITIANHSVILGERRLHINDGLAETLDDFLGKLTIAVCRARLSSLIFRRLAAHSVSTASLLFEELCGFIL